MNIRAYYWSTANQFHGYNCSTVNRLPEVTYIIRLLLPYSGCKLAGERGGEGVGIYLLSLLFTRLSHNEQGNITHVSLATLVLSKFMQRPVELHSQPNVSV